MQQVFILALGLVSGTLLAMWLLRSRLAGREEAQALRLSEMVTGAIGSLSHQALAQNSEAFLRLANERLKKESETSSLQLASKKALIDQSIGGVSAELDRLKNVILELEKDRTTKFSELASRLQTSTEETSKLRVTAESLDRTLSQRNLRGVWGERIADDILRLAGFVEGVNYRKQKMIEGSNGRPDFTFLLPSDQLLNMDVKFPLENYRRYVEATEEVERAEFRKAFSKDVRNRIKEVTGREYINPDAKTLDFVLVFIPNEKLWSVIQESDTNLLELAAKSKVVLCSPFSLYAVLLLIRQALDSFRVEKASSEVLSLLGAFEKQWIGFLTEFEKIGVSLEKARETFEIVRTTRTRKLEVPLRRIEELRKRKGIEAAGVDQLGIGEIEGTKAPLNLGVSP